MEDNRVLVVESEIEEDPMEFIFSKKNLKVGPICSTLQKLMQDEGMYDNENLRIDTQVFIDKRTGKNFYRMLVYNDIPVEVRDVILHRYLCGSPRKLQIDYRKSGAIIKDGKLIFLDNS